LTRKPDKFVSIDLSRILRGEYKSLEELEKAINDLRRRAEKAFSEGKSIYLS
jgi:hypothetical protein